MTVTVIMKETMSMVVMVIFLVTSQQYCIKKDEVEIDFIDRMTDTIV